ncbi:MAG: GWxTD domain-containing protein [Ignavibacteria bacterium]|nr:GWxTD domain-containing protein [Ignavibacteria bacterium]
MKQIKLSFVCFLLLILNPFNSSAQEKFFFDADYTLFRYDNSKALLEVYLAFYHNSIIYKYEKNSYSGNVKIELSITRNPSENKLIENVYKLPVTVTDTAFSVLKQKELSQLPAFIIDEPGNYTLFIRASDEMNPARGDKWEFTFDVPEYDLSSIKMSGIQLATSISDAGEKKNNFIKYGLEVMPNPNQFFGNNINPLYYYVEIYGLKTNLPENKIFLTIRIEDISGKTIFNSSSELEHQFDLLYETGKFNIDSLESGTYFLKFSILDTENNVIDASEKRFFIYNTPKDISGEQVTEENTYLRSEYVVMGEQQINDEFEKAVYIRTDEETRNFDNLKTLESKRKFIYEFWKKRDKMPNTIQNEFKIDYFKRINIANQKFRQSFKDGWKTDRGRIYMIYGEPNDIELYEYQSDIRSHQIWRYELIEGGTICVFAETNFDGSGIYELVHSTIRGELRNDNWKSYIKK